MKNEPLKEIKKRVGSNCYDKEDIKSAVIWLKKEIWNNTAFIEHLTEKQQRELRETIDKAFPNINSR